MLPLGLLLAAAIGGGAAVAGIVFIDGAAAVLTFGNDEPTWWRTLLPPVIAGLICAALARWLPNNRFHGIADSILAAQRNSAPRRRDGFISTLAAFAALSGGASVGQYGPIAHLGGLFGTLSRRATALLPRGSATACGVAAAIAAAFNAPITGLVFAHEIVLRHYSLRTFTPVAVSAVTAYSVSTGIFSRPPFLTAEHMQTLHPTMVLLFAALGGICGLAAAFYLRAIFWIADKTVSIPLGIRLPIAGAVTGLLALALPLISGNDKELLATAIAGSGGEPVYALLAAKTLATLLCLGVGFAGGVVSPTLAVGALGGLFFFQVATPGIDMIPVTVPAAAVVLGGMMAFTAPVIGAPLTAILFVMELSGSYPAAIAAAVAIAIAMQTAIKAGGCSYYDTLLLRHGVDIRQRRDTWLLTTIKISTLAKPPAVSLPPQTPAATAARLALARHTTEVYVVDENNFYHGCWRLPALLNHANAPAATLISPPVTLSLNADDSIATAMRKTEHFVGDNIAVINEHIFIGVINEGDLLRTYNRLAA